MEEIKRRKYLVDRGFQFRYIALIIVPLVLLLIALYYLIYYSVFNEILIPEALAVTLLPAMKKVNTVAIVSIPSILFLIVKLGLIYSNRIIGPIPRLLKELDKAIEGDFSVRIKTRGKDELSTFIDRVNMLLEKMDQTQKISSD